MVVVIGELDGDIGVFNYEGSSVDAVQGIIPAYAGNTFSATPTPTSTGDHPRACGEHTTHDLFVVAELGSSPRMRGTHLQRAYDAQRHGIIPAYAGNTLVCIVCSQFRRDHPRVCGEHISSTCNSMTVRGSSPRMRGTLVRVLGLACSAGIIPAYAGNTCLISRIGNCTRDHPRVCGEHHRLEKR